MKYYLGIDNGISGGLAMVSQVGVLKHLCTMPIQRTKKGNEVNVRLVKQWMIDSLCDHDSVDIIIEEPAGSRFPKMASSMAGSFHAIRATIEVIGYRYERITPQAWQKFMLGKIPQGQTKIAALTKARSLWPTETWLENLKCKKPHDGLVDAALIAEFGRRNNL